MCCPFPGRQAPAGQLGRLELPGLPQDQGWQGTAAAVGGGGAGPTPAYAEIRCGVCISFESSWEALGTSETEMENELFLLGSLSRSSDGAA